MANFKLVPADGLPAVDLERLEQLLPGNLTAYRVVLGNGRWRGDLARLDGLPSGCEVAPLNGASGANFHTVVGSIDRAAGDLSPINALNAAYAEDGVLIHLGAGTRLERPLHVIFVNQGAESTPAMHPRVIVHMGKGSALTLIEKVISDKARAHTSLRR